MLISLILTAPTARVLAHGGRTDGQGGHYNRKTGSYHYHGTPSVYRSSTRTTSATTARVTTSTTPRNTYRSGSTERLDSSNYTDNEEVAAKVRALKEEAGMQSIPPPTTQTVNLRVAPEKTDPSQLFREAEELFAADKKAEAITLYRRIVSKFPDSSEAKLAVVRIQAIRSDLEANEWLVLARNYRRAGRQDLAIEYCLKILEVYPESAAAQAAIDLHKEITEER